ncbi:DUF6265 family protein [Aurantiacibacter sp. D1-12]|uniref:DUF6265 family protein n=1 Tax=Aurantiacibacter sp. D1-12 TaxID=2993658 RepID=UPI00237C56D8|nr:DUF6265 family protein [Aurantiacibacter sp. D1-12]MDE1468199.1 DUF6265 family protein [Aurantiacibacter sp. D1-12]
MRFAIVLPALVAIFALAAPVAAQETRVAGEGHVPPPAEIGQIAWLAGEWTGTGIQGAPAHEAWVPPTGDTMVGLFVQETSEGGIMFTEHMYIREVDGSLQVNLKHFNPDLTGWEERDEMLTFRLVAIEPCAAYFSALTYRCVNPENPDEGLIIAVRMRSEGDEINELRFAFERPDRTEQPSTSCADALTTVDMNECYVGLLESSETRRVQYLEAALARYPNDDGLRQQIASADAAYSAYIDAECGAVYDYWRSGTIRGVMSLTCRIGLNDRGTHNIWQHWLTYMDSTPPILPEPEPTL